MVKSLKSITPREAKQVWDSLGRSVARAMTQAGRKIRGIASDLRVRTGLRQNATGLAARHSEISDIENSSSRDSPPNSWRFAGEAR
jgi:hypothetical protein